MIETETARIKHETTATLGAARERMPSVTDRTPLRIVLATPLGAGGRGGMDRLADLVIGQVNTRGSSQPTHVTRLTTKGRYGKFWGAFVFAAAVLRLLALAATRRADVLHINLAAYGSYHRKSMLAAIARTFGVPYVVHIHTGRFEKFWSEASAHRTDGINSMLRRSARIVVLGQVFERMIQQRLPDVAAKVTVLANATPPRAAQARTVRAGDRVMVTFLGVLCAAKGTPQLIDALGSLAGDARWTATLAGYGDIDQTRQRALELGIADRVSTPGWLDSAAVDELLAETDILVLPSFSEALPMVIIEAFAAGIPVIATPVNAVAEVVRDGENGLLVPPGNVPALSDALQRLIDNGDLRARLGAAGLADHGQHYHPDAYVERLTALWHAAARRTR